MLVKRLGGGAVNAFFMNCSFIDHLDNVYANVVSDTVNFMTVAVVFDPVSVRK